MVTGASGLLGRAIVRALVPRDEVRATVRRPDAADELRELGAKVAVRAGTEPDDLIDILARVHTLVHLIGGVNQPDDEEIFRANHGSTLAAVSAAKEARVRRIVLLSVPGASVDADHPFLRAKGLAEEVVVHSGLEHAVLRCAHAYGLGGLWFTATVVAAEHGFVVGDGRQRLAPLFADDVGAAVASIDDRRDPADRIWHLEGPDVVTAGELAAILVGTSPGEHLLPADAAARLTDVLGIPMSRAAAELFGRGTPPPTTGVDDAAAELGIARTALDDGLRLTADRAAGVR
jgi:uncharacterized protein YbjT (DUF2867 family)